ncbi:receptor-like protein 3 [Ricinus communis]|uniref:receptor-like protein 3 n=1 Tax=Ricinus communis TaxID=3988 RepID=UPI00201A3CF4|nr:receptor-like protein 3 [Ricinus communis]
MLNLVLALFSVFLCCLASLHHACDQFDHESLISFSLNISCSPPLNWSSSSDCCKWEGISCDPDGKVTSLWLPSRGLTGMFSPSIWNLTHLSQLNLSHNRFSGSVVEFFSPLLALEILDLSYNLLHGKLPSFFLSRNIKLVDLSSNLFYGEIPSRLFQQAENLATFNISNNSFTGSIPSSICSNSSFWVKLLDFSYNDFGGLIPNRLGQCYQLQVFRAGYNNLFGSLPQDMFKAIGLQEISLHSNGLSGPISNDITNLTNLKVLELYSNELTGSIPPDIGKLSNLEQLLLHVNNLTGSLPASLANCTNLVTLNLRFNYLEGDLAAFNFSKLLNLRILDLGNNNFTGSLPVTLYSCQSLTAVRLSFNQFEGQILPEIIALKSLSFLSLSYNNLINVTGAIKILMKLKNLHTLLLSKNFWNEPVPNDDEIWQSDGFHNLQILGLGGCQLRGEIPGWLTDLQKLEVLDLSQNKIKGSIPNWFVTLPSLFYIGLDNNLISGEFPRELNLLPALAKGASYQIDRSYLVMPVIVKTKNTNYLQYHKVSYLPPAIYLGNNSISGNIPVELGQLKFLQELDLSNNNFSGNIPEELSKLTNLEKLDLSGNRLTGKIPESLRGLHFLSSFSVAENNLQGLIPSGGQFDTFPLSSFIGNPGLCGSTVNHPCSYQPGTTTHSIDPDKYLNSSLVVGLIAGLSFGFVVGSATGLLYPVRRLKFLKKINMFIYPNGHRKSSVSPLYVPP